MAHTQPDPPNSSSLSDTSPLFPPHLISPSVALALPPNYTIRPLQRGDYNKGFLDVLRVLTQVGEVSAERWEERWEWLTGNGVGGYYVLCVLDGSRAEVDGEVENEERGEGEDGHRDEGVTVTKGEGRIVGTGALVVERKFIHDLGLVGHIEDIAVARDQQGKKLGLRIIQALDFVAERVGCYKTILDCSEANEGFYVKCGFKRAGLQMAHYYEAPKSKYEAS